MKLPFGLVFLGLAQCLISSGWALKPFELVVLHDKSTHCEILSFRETQILRGTANNAVYSTRLPTAAGGHRVSLVSYDAQAVWDSARSICTNDLVQWEGDAQPTVQRVLGTSKGMHSGSVPPPDLQVSPLVVSGPSANRVDLVFFSDGYQPEEYPKFIQDAQRLAEHISYNHTFNTVKPLLNFWAAFTPSKDSGIGVEGKPKDTPYGLYRDGTELRAVYYNNPDVARAACLSLGEQCDYPILMGNDPLYGGLGGEFTVITPSIANGPLVLRHELGHSVIDVGEEYDGGFAYFGVNAQQNLSTPVSWEHWLTNLSSSVLGDARAERSVMPLQAYPWTLLNTTTPWTINFSASGQYSRHVVRFSLSGLPEGSDLTVEIDGTDLGWKPKQGLGVDRWHYDIHRSGGLSDGEHELRFTLKNSDREGIAQMCSVEVLEFGDESQFNSTPGHYSLYPTYSLDNTTTYRPTNEACLMRIVTTPDFCKVCTEDLWLKLLKRVDLIDDVEIGCSKAGTRVVSLKLVPLAELRDVPVTQTESWAITWYKDGKVLDAFTNTTTVDLGDKHAFGTYTIDVQFFSEEIRVDKEGLTASRRNFTIDQSC
ncbi:IgA peptidase M64-domain-containing protein [Cytidiella melzeri]|nr:IgA peptidase M64-domain-containing protein [Cytidiella melzeri]